MRDPNRLDDFYDELKEIHKKSFPDYRFLQLMLDYIGWVMNNSNRDPFFIEEDQCLEFIKQYANDNSPFFKGWRLYGNKKDKLLR